VQIPISTYTALADPGATAALRIHTHVREDALLLFGFATAEEKALFERLISVSGIGPKLAITVLSGLPTADLVSAIRGGDVAHLVRIPGVGKKTAERMVLELRDKMRDLGPAATVAAATAPPSDDLVGALVSLVYNRGPSWSVAEAKDKKGHYTEMRNIRRLMVEQNFQQIPQEIRSMKRLWEGNADMKGLVVRRELEAKLFELGLSES